MFKDYYGILEIERSATIGEIKDAFKKQALKWHPDRNSNSKALERMQEINEAYLILKDVQARERYDIEYSKFESFKKQQKERTSNPSTNSTSDYVIHDDILSKWMTNAKRQAVELAIQTIEDLRGMASVGVKAAAKGAGQQFIYQIIVGILFLLIFVVTKSCSD